MEEHEPKTWMTATEAAAYFRTTRQTLTRMVRRGQIPATKMGAREGRWLFHRPSVEEALLNLRVDSEDL